MNYWMISANNRIYDHASAFAQRGHIDWRQNVNYEIGDIVYIYATKPLSRVMYKTKVEKINMHFHDIDNDEEFWHNHEAYENGQAEKFARLKLINQVDNELLGLDFIRNHPYGVNNAPQRGTKLDERFCQDMDKYFNDYYAENFFLDVEDMEDAHIEGHTMSVMVNKYERSSIARLKCIEYWGCSCQICGIDFARVYGELGNDFIHVHHLVPLHTIKEGYVVNYKEDLIPVCPNCHAMLHRKKINDREVTVDELRKILAKRNEKSSNSKTRRI